MNQPLARPPALDTLLEGSALRALAAVHGREPTRDTARALLARWRQARADLPPGASASGFDRAAFEADCAQALTEAATPSLRPVFNLTGTVLHTNLGRALLAPEAIDAATAALRGFVNLEFDLGGGARGDRDDHVVALLRELTGAEAATVVNNNAAAVLLTLAALGSGKEAIVSRGELIEIGGAFRIPDIMRRAGCRLVEVGTTNRTHLKDFAEAIGPKTALLLKVHTSNYAIQGFTSAVAPAELGALARERGVAFVEDLGSGTLVDLTRWGLPAEPTPRQSIEAGAQVVTFSGDKLLGGPQAGLIVGQKDLIARIKRNPLKRSLRCDKATLAALEATLRLYRDPDRLPQRLPTLRLLTRSEAELTAQGQRLLPAVRAALAGKVQVELQPCKSQIGSGSLPVDRLPSVCLALASPATGAGADARRSGGFCNRLADALRALPTPVVGRIEDGWVKLDLRCLDGAAAEQAFVEQMGALDLEAAPPRKPKR